MVSCELKTGMLFELRDYEWMNLLDQFLTCHGVNFFYYVFSCNVAGEVGSQKPLYLDCDLVNV